jgi:predicted naringenin-chalcone synthase
MGCHGALNGLRVAKAFTDADPNACVLICAVELCSLHHQYGWDPEKVVANALFADGAAAIVGCRGSAAGNSNWCLTDSGSTIIESSEDSMRWRIGNHGFEMTLSPQVPDIIHQHLPAWLDRWLAEHGLSVDEIGSWAIHPGGPKVLTACAEAAGFDTQFLEPSKEILAEFGNMSSPTVLFILQRLQEREAARPCVILGFGPGLAVEAALVR